MEKIYTIPVNDAFNESSGCPFCRMRQKLEKDEVNIILGASMMEPDIRIKTNEKGFCSKHFGDLLRGQKRLPLALMLESHLEEILKECVTPAIAVKGRITAVADKLNGFCNTCYICEKVEFHLEKMFETSCLLWENDVDFRKKYVSKTFFCLPCYTRLLKTAKRCISKKQLDDFLKTSQEIEMGYLKSLKDDVSWFCKKFDYRFQEEPWGNSKDSVERTVELLCGTDVVPETSM